MSEVCRCRHNRPDHRHWSSKRPIGCIRCECSAWNVAVLPAPGERLEFGKHRLNSPEAEAAPAWPSLTEVQARRDREYEKGRKA